MSVVVCVSSEKWFRKFNKVSCKVSWLISKFDIIIVLFIEQFYRFIDFYYVVIVFDPHSSVSRQCKIIHHN